MAFAQPEQKKQEEQLQQAQPKQDITLHNIHIVQQAGKQISGLEKLPNVMFFQTLLNAGLTKEDAVHLLSEDNTLFIKAFTKLVTNAPKQFASLVASGNQPATDIYVRAIKETKIIEAIIPKLA